MDDDYAPRLDCLSVKQSKPSMGKFNACLFLPLAVILFCFHENVPAIQIENNFSDLSV